MEKYPSNEFVWGIFFVRAERGLSGYGPTNGPELTRERGVKRAGEAADKEGRVKIIQKGTENLYAEQTIFLI